MSVAAISVNVAWLAWWPWGGAPARLATPWSPARTLRTLETGVVLNQPRDAARALGWSITTGDNWTILWSYRTPWDSDAYKKWDDVRRAAGPPASVLFNHIPGTLRLASKAHLPEFVRSAGLSDAIPRSYLLPEQQAAALQALEVDGLLGPGGWPKWLVKSKRHRGVKVLLNATKASLSASAPAIMQRRVEPLLLRRVRRAFDIGLYVLVTSVRPLRIYAYEKALVRFCERSYPSTPRGLADDERTYVISHYAPIWTLPPFAASLRACNDSAACALRAELDSDGHDAALIWRRMRTLAGRLLSALLPHVYDGLQRLRLADESVFELFRFDFLVDERGAPVLTEVNISPNLVAASPQDGKVKAALVRDTLRLAMLRLDLGAPHGSANAAAWRAAKLAEAEAAAAGGFRRIAVTPTVEAEERGLRARR